MVSDIQDRIPVKTYVHFCHTLALRLKSFNCRTTVNNLIHIKYVKNSNHLGIDRNSERGQKHPSKRQDVFILKTLSKTDLKR